MKRAPQLVETKYPTVDHVVADYNVLDFGADPTGKSDSTQSIQAALNTAATEGAGIVWMPTGTYVLTDTVAIPPYCSLRGDWRDPDKDGADYGTVIEVQVEPGLWGPCCFLLAGCTHISGLTFYWPNQNAEHPIPYNYAISMPGAHLGLTGYMVSNIENITLLNAYKGIALSVTDQTGRHDDRRMPHDLVAIRHIKGSPLYRGIVNTNNDDHSTSEDVVFNSSYWANAGDAYHAPDEEVLKAFTRANGHAFCYGDCEWEMSINLHCSDYLYGIRIIDGLRTQFVGQFSQVDLQNCQTAVRFENGFSGIGRAAQFINSTLDGEYSLQDLTGELYINLSNCKLTGSVGGPDMESLPNLKVFTEEQPWYDVNAVPCPKVTRAVLYDVTKAPYFAPYTIPQSAAPAEDATLAIQKALDDAGREGGGIVYLPAGWYRLNTHLQVPANVELRGCLSCTRELETLSAGTVLMAYEGKGTIHPSSATALITLVGDNSGVNGLRVFYPENNPDFGIHPYPFTIRGSSKNMYVVNVGLSGAWNGVDFCDGCDGHYIRRVIGTCHNLVVRLGACITGTIQACHTNCHGVHRSGYHDIYHFPAEGSNYSQYAMADVGDSVIRRHEVLALIDGAENEHFHQNGAYMITALCKVRSGSVQMMNNVVDNCASWGYHCYAPGQDAHVIMENAMQYNGTLSHGYIQSSNRKMIDWRPEWNVRL